MKSKSCPTLPVLLAICYSVHLPKSCCCPWCYSTVTRQACPPHPKRVSGHTLLAALHHCVICPSHFFEPFGEEAWWWIIVEEGKVETALRRLDVWRKWCYLWEMHFLVELIVQREKENVKQRGAEQRVEVWKWAGNGWESERWEGCVRLHLSLIMNEAIVSKVPEGQPVEQYLPDLV